MAAKKPKITITSPMAALLALQHCLYGSPAERRKLVSYVLASRSVGCADELIRLAFGDSLKRYALTLAHLHRAVVVVTQEGKAPQSLSLLGIIPAERRFAAVRLLLLARVLRRPRKELTSEWYRKKFSKTRFLAAERKSIREQMGTHVLTRPSHSSTNTDGPTLH